MDLGSLLIMISWEIKACSWSAVSEPSISLFLKESVAYMRERWTRKGLWLEKRLDLGDSE